MASLDQNSNSDSNDGTNTGKYSDWMGELPVELHRVPLNQLAIPGSHNSFAYYLEKQASVAPNMPLSLHAFVKPYFFGGMAKELVYRYAVTQEKSCTEQLSLGIRFFDIRSAWNDPGGAYFVHGFWGTTVRSGMEEMEYFLRNHPKEIIILDFKELHDFTQERHRQLLEMLVEVFGKKLCPCLNMETVNLKMMWELQYQVIVRYAYYDTNMTKEYFCWPTHCITSPWPNARDPNTAISFLEKCYNISRCRDKFHVTQGVLTPNVVFIARHVFSTLKNTCANVLCDPFLGWLEKKKAGKDGINICIMDYVEEDFISVMIKLNMDLATECKKIRSLLPSTFNEVW